MTGGEAVCPPSTISPCLDRDIPPGDSAAGGQRLSIPRDNSINLTQKGFHFILFSISDRGGSLTIFRSLQFQSMLEGKDDGFHGMLTFLLEGVLLLAVALVGLGGNLISFVTIFSQKIQKTFHNLLFLLTVFDMVRFDFC